MQGDQLLEVNGQNVRESNQKDVAQLINELDGAIVLLLGRVPTLTQAIHEWARKKSHLHWRTRTSTWSSYSCSNKDKVQNQRPSLPISKDATIYFSLHTPDNDEEPTSPFAQFFPSLVGQTIDTDEGMISRTSSIRSRVRLSIVVEDTKQRNQEEEEEEEQEPDEDEEDEDEDGEDEDVSTDNHLLPSIQVTEY